MNKIHRIPLKFDSYEDIFYEFDYRTLDMKDVSDDVDSFITSQVSDLITLKNFSIVLEIYLPKSVFNEEKENLTSQGIDNYYDSKITFDNNLSKMGLRRLLYYFIVSTLFFILWYFAQDFFGDTFLTIAFDTAGTVILWQAMTLIFIERKNHNVNKGINKLFSEMKIVFKYF